MRPSCSIWFRIRLSARAFHNHIDLFLRGNGRPRVTYYGIITFCLKVDPHVETPAFQWCCREERSTPEKCAGHIAEFEMNLAPESHVQGPRSCASFYLGTKGARVTSILWNVSRRIRSPRRGFRASGFSLCLLRCPTQLLCRRSIRTPLLLLWSDLRPKVKHDPTPP